MTDNHYIEQRPWGQFEILSKFSVKPEGDVCVKIITVKPHSRLSYQSHQYRSEHWSFVQGRGTVIIDDVPSTVVSGSQVFIAVTSKHRVINEDDTMDLVFVETSIGRFDENDIQRFEDDYGRAG